MNEVIFLSIIFSSVFLSSISLPTPVIKSILFSIILFVIIFVFKFVCISVSIILFSDSISLIYPVNLLVIISDNILEFGTSLIKELDISSVIPKYVSCDGYMIVSFMLETDGIFVISWDISVIISVVVIISSSIITFVVTKDNTSDSSPLSSDFSSFSSEKILLSLNKSDKGTIPEK